MFFLGGFTGCDAFSLPCSPVCRADITEVRLQNGRYDTLFASKKTDNALTPAIPDDWDFDTIMYAKFNKNSLNAGNVNWTLNNISHILIKRREINTFHWTTIAVKEILKKTDFKISGTDYTTAAKTEYEYAVVPFYYGVEGDYDTTRIYSDFNEIFILGKNGTIHTPLGSGYLDVTNNAPSSYITTIHGRYPTVIRNSRTNYKTGSFSGNFIKYDGRRLQYSVDDRSITNMQNDVIRFLSDGIPKLIKHFDGRTILANIDSDIANNAEGHYKNRVISFNFTEIGDYTSAQDLYSAGLSDVSEEWW